MFLTKPVVCVRERVTARVMRANTWYGLVVLRAGLLPGMSQGRTSQDGEDTCVRVCFE